jgi:multiple sugar transport system ATP-binding protein
MTMGTRIVVMKDGFIQQVDAPLKIYSEPVNLFVAGFLGTPPMNFVKGTLTGMDGGIVFQETQGGAVELKLGDRKAASAYLGKEVILGVRPEDCDMVLPGEKAVEHSFLAVVDLVEPMGAETYFYIQTGAHTMISRSSSMMIHRETGHRQEFSIKVNKVHLFDPVTTNRIV